MTGKNDGEKWNELVREWEIARHLAQLAQAGITQKMRDCYLGKGGNPSMEELQKTETLWAIEGKTKAAMDSFIKERFG